MTDPKSFPTKEDKERMERNAKLQVSGLFAATTATGMIVGVENAKKDTVGDTPHLVVGGVGGGLVGFMSPFMAMFFVIAVAIPVGKFGILTWQVIKAIPRMRVYWVPETEEESK